MTGGVVHLGGTIHEELAVLLEGNHNLMDHHFCIIMLSVCDIVNPQLHLQLAKEGTVHRIEQVEMGSMEECNICDRHKGGFIDFADCKCHMWGVWHHEATRTRHCVSLRGYNPGNKKAYKSVSCQSMASSKLHCSDIFHME